MKLLNLDIEGFILWKEDEVTNSKILEVIGFL